MKKKSEFTELLIYTSPQGKVKVEVVLHNENIRLPQKRIAELFGVDVRTINDHIQNIYKSWELSEDPTIRKNRIVQNEWWRSVKREISFYNLDVIIAVGYRVSGRQATHFRMRATERLKEYIIKWFTMDDERLKNPEYLFGIDYFEEQLARIRDIRSSERRFYQKITDIYAACSADYDSNDEMTKIFFATVQNKLHRAISGQTAAEIISDRVDSKKENMWLTSWKNSPKGKIRKTDVVIAKNYLNEQELIELNHIVFMYLDYAESQARKHKIMLMQDRIEKLDAFLKFNEQEILEDAGRVSHEVAIELAEKEYEKFSFQQDKLYESDFDRLLKKLPQKI